MSEEFKEAVRKRTEGWKDRMMKRYAPSGDLGSLGLNGSRVILQRQDTPWRLLTNITVTAIAWTLERTGHEGENYLLMLENASIWDAEKKWEMLYKNHEFTVLDANGVCFQTKILFIEGGKGAAHSVLTKDTAKIVTADGHEYYVDLYWYGLRNRFPMIGSFEERAELVVRDESDVRWFSPRCPHHRLELVDQDKNVVLSLGGISRREMIWQSLGSRNFGPRRYIPVRYLDNTVPREVVLFLAGRTLQY